jgi:hypothetical protein
VEQHSADLQAGKVDAHCLTWLKHWHVPSSFDCRPVIADLQEWLFYVGGVPQFPVTDNVYRAESSLGVDCFRIARDSGAIP